MKHSRYFCHLFSLNLKYELPPVVISFLFLFAFERDFEVGNIVVAGSRTRETLRVFPVGRRIFQIVLTEVVFSALRKEHASPKPRAPALAGYYMAREKSATRTLSTYQTPLIECGFA